MIAAWPLYLVTGGVRAALDGRLRRGYDVASDVVVILSLTMLLATACGPVDSVLLMAGRSWLSLRNSIVALAVNVGLNVVLIPLYGIRGAAIAWAVAIVVRNLLPLVQVRRHLGLWPLTRSTVAVALGGPRLLRHRGRRRRRHRPPRGRRRGSARRGHGGLRRASGLVARRWGSGPSARRCDGPRRLGPATAPSRARPSGRLTRCTPGPRRDKLVGPP